MSKYPEYQHTKSRAWFDRALQVIPSGVYGHLGPSEGLFLPLEKWPLLSSKAKGAYFWDLDGNPYLDLMCAYGPMSWATATPTWTGPPWSADGPETAPPPPPIKWWSAPSCWWTPWPWRTGPSS